MKTTTYKNLNVFLGGVCGNTTWRETIAIPAFEEAGIKYFNPQLPPGTWTPEASSIEMEAKNNADCWLFVIDGSTRAIASLVEASWAIGRFKNIVLVINDVSQTLEDGTVLSPSEMKDLNRGRHYLKEVALAAGYEVFDLISDAVKCCCEMKS